MLSINHTAPDQRIVVRVAGLVLVVAGLVGWALAVGGQPALVAAGLAPVDRDLIAQEYSSGVQLVLLLGAHDLRLAALLVTLAGTGLLVAPLRAAWRALLAVAAVLAVSNLVWGLLPGVPVVFAVAVTAGLVTGTFVLAARRPGPPGDGGRSVVVVPALLCAGAAYVIPAQAALDPTLRATVPSGWLVLLAVTKVLLVAAAVVGAWASGPRHPLGRARAGLLVVVAVALLTAAGVGTSLWRDDGWAGPLAGAVSVAVLLIAWTGRSVRPGAGAVGGLVVAAAAPLVPGLLPVLGLFFGLPSLVLSGAEIGADGLPMIGAGLVFGALLVVAYAMAGPGPLPRMP